MHVFDFGSDVHELGLVAQKLSWEAGIFILLLAVIFIGLHLLRRAFGPPDRAPAEKAPPPGVGRVERYELGARLYHWGNFVVLLLLLVSGAAFFFAGWLPPLKPWAGISWLLVHEILAGLFIALLILHIVFSIVRTGLGAMWFGRGDGRDLARRAGYHFGGSAPLPRTGKYDVAQKIYHLLLAIFAVVMIATGISLFLNAEVFTSLGHGWMRWQRILHDIFAFLFAAVIIGHVYLRLLRPRWPALRAMITGWISRDEFERDHDWKRWQPEPPQAPRERGTIGTSQRKPGEAQ